MKTDNLFLKSNIAFIVILVKIQTCDFYFFILVHIKSTVFVSFTIVTIGYIRN